MSEQAFEPDTLGMVNAGKLPANSRSNVYENGRTVKSGPGLLCGFSVYNSNASAQFILVFDVRSFAELTSASVPEVVFSVAGATDREWNWIPPRTFKEGIVVANSSTGPTYTAGPADCWFDAQYI